MTNGRTKLFIDATPLISSKMSGIGHVVLETTRALDTQEVSTMYEVNLFLPRNEKGKLDRYNFRHIGVKYLPFPHKFFSLFSRLRLSPPLDMLLGRGVYIFPNYRNWPLIASKSLTYIHDVCFAIFPEYVEERNQKYLSKYIKLWLSRTDMVVTVSDSSREEIKNYLGVDAEEMITIPNAINTNFFYPRSIDEITSVRKKYDLSDDYMLYLGNIEPRKNLTTLIEAFTSSSLSKTSELFLVGGDGWRNEKVYQQIEEAAAAGVKIRKNSSYIPDEDLPALISGARALVQPSWHEGFGLAVLQAIACGTQVICADIASLREVTAHKDKITPLYFHPSDTAQLTEIFNQLPHKSLVPVPDNIDTWKHSTKKLLTAVETLKAGKG